MVEDEESFKSGLRWQCCIMQELQATHKALQQSRLACEERDYLIATHERSEAALAGHAGALTDELQRASDSMASLFSRHVGRPSSQPSNTLDGSTGNREPASLSRLQPQQEISRGCIQT